VVALLKNSIKGSSELDAKDREYLDSIFLQQFSSSLIAWLLRLT
jgi:hypothetical protein